MSESEIRRSINAFVFDNPHIFWLDNLLVMLMLARILWWNFIL